MTKTVELNELSVTASTKITYALFLAANKPAFNSNVTYTFDYGTLKISCESIEDLVLVVDVISICLSGS